LCCTQWPVQRSLHICSWMAKHHTGQHTFHDTHLFLFFIPSLCVTSRWFTCFHALYPLFHDHWSIKTKQIKIPSELRPLLDYDPHLFKSLLLKETWQWKGILKIVRAQLNEPSMAKCALSAYGSCIYYRFKQQGREKWTFHSFLWLAF